MLARTYKTAAELKIAENVREALITVMLDLDAGVYPAYDWESDILTKGQIFFHMRLWKCGTIRCIGGLVGDIIDPTNNVYKSQELCHHADRKNPLYPLFYPHQEMYNCAPERAARAIRSFLTTGGPDWDDGIIEA